MGRFDIVSYQKNHKKYGLITFILLIISSFIMVNFKISKVYGESIIRGSSGILIEANTKTVLSGENIHARLPMASTTKIMTALIVLENKNIDEVITVSPLAVGVEGSSIYIKKDEKWLIRDLLYGLMLRSGNDSAVALAIATGGSIENFVKMMNQKAEKLGLKNTNFMNPHGLHDDNHYTSAYDLAMITAEAFKIDEFKKIVSTKNYHNKDTGVNFVYKNKILSTYEGANGVKTGYTKAAGRCLVASAKRNDMQLIAVAINHGDMYNDCMRYFDYGFNNYVNYKFIRDDLKLQSISVKKGKCDEIMLYAEKTFDYPIKKEDIDKVELKLVNMNEKYIYAPINSGDKVGELIVSVDSVEIGRVNVIVKDNVEKQSHFDIFSRKIRDFFKG